jgi:hypothetical protein
MVSTEEMRPILRPQTPELPEEMYSKDQLRVILKVLLTTCPGSWNGSISDALRRFTRGTCSKQEELAIKVTIHRHMTTMFIDSIVESYGLVKAQDKTLLYWDSDLWYDHCDRHNDKRWQQFSTACYRRGLMFKDRTGLFSQAYLYLVDCIYKSPIDFDESFHPGTGDRTHTEGSGGGSGGVY